MSGFAVHDPDGPVIYLSNGMISPAAFQMKRHIIREQGVEAWFAVLAEDLRRSLAAADPERVNVHHFTVHPGEFPLEVIEGFLSEVVDPLVAEGKVR
ncbi:hypothetical protein LR090_04240 [Candidatus Bipolaricaulota bacterium]|nr:hypothetical protein [Candidatus Bipolaricaulota bacterium]